jgi:hypothetical protein
MQMLKNALACPTPVVIQRYSRDSRSRPSPPFPSLPIVLASRRNFSTFLYLWLADKSTAASAPPPFALASSPRCYYLCTARYAVQHNFLVHFCPPPPTLYVPHMRGRKGETRLCPRQENSRQDEQPVSLGVHADVTAAKHVLIICKRRQVDSGVSAALGGSGRHKPNPLASR